MAKRKNPTKKKEEVKKETQAPQSNENAKAPEVKEEKKQKTSYVVLGGGTFRFKGKNYNEGATLPIKSIKEISVAFQDRVGKK